MVPSSILLSVEVARSVVGPVAAVSVPVAIWSAEDPRVVGGGPLSPTPWRGVTLFINGV